MDGTDITNEGQAAAPSEKPAMSWKRFATVVYSGVILLICILLRVSEAVQLSLVGGFTLTVLTFIGADTTQKIKELMAGITQKAQG